MRLFSASVTLLFSVSIGALLTFVPSAVGQDNPAALAGKVVAKSQSRSFRYGVCAHLGRSTPEVQQKLFDLLDQLGVDTLRDSIEWGGVEKEEGQYDFARFDQLVDGANARGIDLQGLVGFSTLWASTSTAPIQDWQQRVFSAPRIEPFTRYIDMVARRYAGRVKFWEIWNEPEIGFWRSTPAEFVELFNAASAAFAKADPNAKVINGGFAMERRPPNMTFLEEFLRGADQTNWNIWAYHDYNTLTELLQRAQLHARYYKSAGAKMPVWINEGGFNTLNRGGGETEQAVTLAKKLAVAPSLGVQAYVWYDFYDDGDSPKDAEHHFGLIRRDFTPKPAYYAYQQLIRELAPRKFDHRISESAELGGVWGLVYQASGDHAENVLVLWREGKDRQTPLWIGGGEGGAATSVVDINGKPIDAPQVDGGVLVNVTDVPVYVHLRDSIAPVLRPILSLPDKLAVLPGEPSSLTIDVSNPTSKAQDFSVAVHGDVPQMQVSAPSAPLHLGPGERQSVKLDLTVPRDIAASHSNGVVSASLRVGNDGPEMTASLPYRVALIIPRLADAVATQLPQGQGLQLPLTDREHIVNLFTAEPAPKMQWHGPDDLSAIGSFAWNDEALYMRIAVTDDKHAQSNHAAEIWRGDSLQFAVRTDDSSSIYFEGGLALGDDGKTSGWVYAVPVNSPIALGVMEKPIDYTIQRSGTQTTYLIRLPWKAFGIDKPPATGLRLNFIANDDDGDGRKGWVQITDGIGKGKSPDLFTTFVCK